MKNPTILRSKGLLTCAGLFASLTALPALTINQTNYAPDNSNLWNNAAVWGGNSVTSGNNYNEVAGPTTIGTSFEVGDKVWLFKSNLRDTSGPSPASTTFAGTLLINNADTRILLKGRNGTTSTANIKFNGGGHIVLAPDAGGSGTAGTATLAGTIEAPLGTLSAIGLRPNLTNTFNVNSTLVGSGNIHVVTAGGTSATAYLKLGANINGFEGTLYLSTNTGTVENGAPSDSSSFSIAAMNAPGATLNLATSSPRFHFNLNGALTFRSVVVGDTLLAPGTYTYANLDAIAPGKFINNGGSITVLPHSPFTAADALNAYDAYHDTFYVVSSGRGYYKTSQTNSNRQGFWTYAEMIEMAIDAYVRTQRSAMLARVNELITGFSYYNGTSWSGNTFNDDVMWACIAYLRAYDNTGNTSYRTTAKNNFDMAYARAWSTDLGGGLWWTTSMGSKNSCVNGPGAIAAYKVYEFTGDSGYLTKAQNIYNWQKATLFNPSTGAIWDNINAAGTVSKGTTSYNQGTFIGAGYFLGDSTSWNLAANFAKNAWGPDMMFTGFGNDGGGFNGICLRWMRVAGFDATWRRSTADLVWSRRRADNLIWNDWGTPTGSGSLNSWDCSAAVCALMAVSPN